MTRDLGTVDPERVLQLVYCKIDVGTDLRGSADLVEQSEARAQVL